MITVPERAERVDTAVVEEARDGPERAKPRFLVLSGDELHLAREDARPVLVVLANQAAVGDRTRFALAVYGVQVEGEEVDRGHHGLPLIAI